MSASQARMTLVLDTLQKLQRKRISTLYSDVGRYKGVLLANEFYLTKFFLGNNLARLTSSMGDKI